MENKFPSIGTFEAMIIQSAKCLSILLLMVITATPSHAFHLPVHHSNSTNGNSTDSDDFHHRFREDTHSENGTQNYQYGRLSSNSTGHVYKSPHDAHKEEYKNDTVHIVSPLAKHPNIPENFGNVKAKSEHKIMPGKMEAKMVDSHEEEAKELSEHGLLVDIPHNHNHDLLVDIPHNHKQESRPDKNPSIATYKNDIQKKEPDTTTKLLTLEQRIAAYLLQNKHHYLPNSTKDKKSDEKKEVIVSGLPANMDNSEDDGNTKVGQRVQNMDGANVKPQSRDHKSHKNVQEMFNTKLSPKYTLYDDIGKDDIGTDHAVKDDIMKGDIIKDKIRKEDGNHKDKYDASTNNGKDGHTKDNSKIYDYYYDSERRHVTGSVRPHYDYDDKGYVTEDAADDKEEKHKNKDILKGRTGETLLHETEIFHEKGSFHTVENFVEEKSHSQKQQLGRKKTKPGSKDSEDNNEEVAVSAFKARVTRGEDENEGKRSVDMKHSPKMYQQSDNSSPPSKDKDHSDDSGDNKNAETGVESNTQSHISDPLYPTGPAVNNHDNESLPKKDQFLEKQLIRGANASLEVQNVGTEHTSPGKNGNEMDKHEKDNTEREDEVKALTRSELSNEANLPTDQKSWPGADNVEEVNSVLKYSTDNELPKNGDTKDANNENTTQEILQPTGSDRNEVDSSDLNKPDAQPKAYLAAWASTASKNTTHSNVSFNIEAPSSARPQTVKGKTESSIGDNKTMPQVNLWINKTNQDNKTADSQVMGNKTEGLLNVQNERAIKSVNNNTALSNEQMQNASNSSQDNINISNDANNNTNTNDHTLANSQSRARSDSTRSNNSTHVESKMEVNVNKLKATPETASLNNSRHVDSKMEVNVNKLKATPETVGLNNRTHADSKMEVNVNKLKATPETVGLNNRTHADSKMEVNVNKLKATPETVGLNNRTHTDSKMEVNVNKLKATAETASLNNRTHTDSKMETDVNKLKATPETVGLNNRTHADSKMEVNVNKLKATPETVGLNNSRHIDSKMETDVNKLKAAPQADGLKWVPSETVERATSSRKSISQTNEYQKVPDQLAPFDASVATMNNINNRKQNPQGILLETNRTSSTTNVSDKSQLYKHKQPTTPDLNLGSSNKVGISVNAKETNNSSIIEKGLSMNFNSSKEETKIDDNKKERNLYSDDLNPATYGISRNLSYDVFTKTNISSLPLPDNQTKLQSNSTTEMLKVSKTDSKLQNNNSVGINITAAQTSTFKVESFAATTNQSEARNIKQEQETHTEKPGKLSTTTVQSTKSNVPSQKSAPANSNTLKNSQDGNSGNSSQVHGKADAKTKLADKQQEVVVRLPLSHKSNTTASGSQGVGVSLPLSHKSNTTASGSQGVGVSLPLSHKSNTTASGSQGVGVSLPLSHKSNATASGNQGVVVSLPLSHKSNTTASGNQGVGVSLPLSHKSNTTASGNQGVVVSLPLSHKSNTTASGNQGVVVSLPLSHKSNTTASGNQLSNVNTTNDRKNNVSVNSSPRADGTSLDSNNRNYTDQQQGDHIYLASHLANDSHSKENIHVSNKSLGLNVPRKLLSISDLEVHENKSNKTIKTVHKIENNGGLTGKVSNISKRPASKGNTNSGEIKMATVTTEKDPKATESILKNGSEHLNGSRVTSAVKAKNVTEVTKVHQHTNVTNTSVKRGAIPEPSRTEQGISVNRTIQDKNTPQNISNVHKSKESDPVVKITFTVKKNGSNPRIEGLSKNATSNSFHEKAGPQPEVMANERHQQQKSQNQKLEPDIFIKGEIVDGDDMKMDTSTNKAGTRGRINNKEDDDKSKSSNNNGASRNLSDGNDGEEEIGSQQLAGDERNYNEKGENNDNKTRNRSHDSSDADKNSDVLKKNDEGSDRIANEAVREKQSVDESSAILDQEMGTGMNQKNSDLRGDKQLVNIDSKQIHNNDKASSNQKTTTIGKDISQDVDSATTNDVKPPERDVESRFKQNEADAKNDDVIDDVPKKDQMANSSGYGSSNSAVPSDKIPEISPYKVQDFSLLKPSTTKATANKDKNKTDQVKAKPPPAVPAAAANTPKNSSSTENSANASSNVRSECQDACVPDPGMAIPRGAQAAVSAVLTTHFGPTKDQMIPFDLELLDLADNYDNTTGMFICTIPGTYVISLYLMSHPGAKVNARVLINNRPIAALWADDAKNAGFYPSSSTQTIAQLAFGDQVYVMLVDGGYGDSWVHANYNVFTIFLLYEQMF